MTASPKILVVDDESDVGEFVFAAAQGMGFECAVTTDAKTFLEALTPDTTLILLDLLMPEIDGVELLRLLGEQKCKAGIVLMSGVGKRVRETAEQLAQILGLSIVGHLQKPFRLAELEEVLAKSGKPASSPIIHPCAQITKNEELRTAIERNEFVLYYQPQIDIATGRVIGVEALVRWKHPRLGVVPPIKFIPMAEETGLIVPIGDWVLREACRRTKAWHDAGLPPIAVSVNVSARQFKERNLVTRVASALKESGLDAKYLELEVTESLIMQDVELAVATMRDLQSLGVQLAIDDFGTGYSSLSALKTFPVTRLKIDKSFIDGLLVTGFPYDLSTNPWPTIDYFTEFLIEAGAVRRLGSAALDLAYVAAGRFDGYWEVSLAPWDMAAGILLVQEAGGRLSNLTGEPQSIYEKSVLASNGRIHDAMLAVLNASPRNIRR